MRTRPEHPGRETTLVSTWRVPRPERKFGFYTGMLIEDILAGVVPSRLDARAEFQARLLPPDSEVERAVVQSLSYGRNDLAGRGRDLTGAVTGLLSEAVRLLILQGEALYEIGYVLENGSVRRPKGFVLSEAPLHSLSFRFGRVYQTQPPDPFEGRAEPHRVRIPKDHILRIRVPRQLGGVSGFRRVLRDLDQLNAPIFSDFAMAEVQRSPHLRVFDIEAHQADLEVAVARITRSIGWPGRGLFRRATDGFYFSRLLRFGLARSLLREAALAAINETLKRVGPELGFTAALEIIGMPSSGDLTRALSEYDAGRLSFTDIRSMDLEALLI